MADFSEVSQQKTSDFYYYEMGGLRIIPVDKIGVDDIHSREDADRIYKYICDRLKMYKLDNLLLKIHDEFLDNKYPIYRNFIPSMVKFILLNSTMYGEINSIPNDEFFDLLRKIISYELYDPQFDKEINRKQAATSYFLRSIGQLQWDRNIRFMLSRTLFLYDEILKEDSAPKYIKDIVGQKFKEKFGLTLLDFIKIGAVLWAGSISRKGGLRRDYLENARGRGMTVPNDESAKICLRLIAYEPIQFRTDPLLKKYNLNPLLSHPLVRLWEKSEMEEMFDDKFIAPIPDIVIYRISIGLYYQLYNIFGMDFATNFGVLFELYVKKIIEGFRFPGKVITEKDIDIYLPFKGKKGGTTRRPDWVMFSENGIILIECKAMHYTQDTFEHGINAKDTAWMTQIRKALDQFDKFEQQIPELCRKLGIHYPELRIQKIIVSFEPLLGLKYGPLREFIDGKKKRDWVLIPVEDLEEIQPYIAKGYDLWSFISEYKNASHEDFNKIIEKMQLKTGADDSENMFHSYRTKILEDLLRDADRKKLETIH